MLTRRQFLDASLTTTTAVALVSGRAAYAAIPEAPSAKDGSTQPPLVPTTGPDYNPVVTLNGWTLPWRMNGEWKEFHLVAEAVVREIAPGMKAYLWGYNGQSPGPTIEAVAGDKVRIYVTNKLPEHTGCSVTRVRPCVAVLMSGDLPAEIRVFTPQRKFCAMPSHETFPQMID